MLKLCSHLPEVEFAPGDTVVHEGRKSGAIWVLVSGSLEVLKGAVVVNTVNQPGATVGEISVLLGSAHGATVRATQRSVLRHAVDGRALLARDPAISRLVAVGLAERLNFVTTYLVDLKHQHGDARELAMVSDVLHLLSQRQGPAAEPGSARDPHPNPNADLGH